MFNFVHAEKLMASSNTQSETILSGAMNKQRFVRDVPGGTISFLFEKCSKTVPENDDGENTEQ